MDIVSDGWFSLITPLCFYVTVSEFGTEKELSLVKQRCSWEVKTDLISRRFSRHIPQAPEL